MLGEPWLENPAISIVLITIGFYLLYRTQDREISPSAST
jgi:hypothetical protein